MLNYQFGEPRRAGSGSSGGIERDDLPAGQSKRRVEVQRQPRKSLWNYSKASV